jgi:hypothetical protein
MAISLLIDENSRDRKFMAALHSANVRIAAEWKIETFSIRCVGDANAPTIGTKDPELLKWCAEYGWTLVTQDASSIPLYHNELITGGISTPGVIVLHAGTHSYNALASQVILLSAFTERHEIESQCRYLPSDEFEGLC